MYDIVIIGSGSPEFTLGGVDVRRKHYATANYGKARSFTIDRARHIPTPMISIITKIKERMSMWIYKDLLDKILPITFKIMGILILFGFVMSIAECVITK